MSYDVMALSEAELACIRKADMGYVLQTGGLLSFFTVQENIMLPCQLNGWPMLNRESRAWPSVWGLPGN